MYKYLYIIITVFSFLQFSCKSSNTFSEKLINLDCNKKNIIKNLKALSTYNKILIEEFIGGREIQVAIMNNKTLGTIELEPKRKFYDYEAKYNSNAKTKHIIPVNLSKKNLQKIKPRAIIQVYETGTYAKTFEIVAKKLGIIK